MKKRTKTLLFLSLAAIFTLSAPLAVFYSLGWRFDWQEKKITQPGILFFKVLPKSSQIYINGKLKKKTDFFFGSALIDNLTPKKYEIEIKKDGFLPWKKTLEIKKGQATEAKNIVLFKEQNEFKSISEKTEKFFVSPSQNQIIAQETSTKDADWTLYSFNVSSDAKTNLISKNDILLAKNSGSDPKSLLNPKNTITGKEKIELAGLTFSSDSKKILLKISLDSKIKFYVLEASQLALINLQETADIKNAYFNPKNSQKILFLKSNSLYEKNLSDSKIPALVKESILFFSIINNDIFYITKQGFVFRTNYDFSENDKINNTALPVKNTDGFDIIYSNPYLFLTINNSLYKLEEESGNFSLFFEPIKKSGFSHDSKKIFYYNDKELWVLFLEKIYEQPEKEKEERLFITRTSEIISNVFWLNDHYLVFYSENKIKVAEIDSRDKINIFDIAELKNAEIFWSEIYKKLFVFSDKNFLYSDKIINY